MQEEGAKARRGSTVIAGDPRASIKGVRSGRAVDPAPFAAIVRTMALEHHKWDHRELGLHAELARLFASPLPPSPAAARIMRFDFHPTTDGWRVSEVNGPEPYRVQRARFTARIELFFKPLSLYRREDGSFGKLIIRHPHTG